MRMGRTSRVSAADDPVLRKRLLYLAVGRVLFILLFAVYVVYLQRGHVLAFSSPALRLVTAAVAGTLAASAIYLVLCFRLSRHLYWLAFVQIQLDLLLWGTIVSVSGGVDSYFTFLFSLSIVISAVYLGERGVIFTLVLCVATYVLVVLGGLLEWYPDPGSILGMHTPPAVRDLVVALVLDIGSMILVAMLGWVLALQVTRTGESLERTKEIFEDLHRLNEAIVMLLPSGLVSTDAEGRIRSANPTAARILGAGLVGRKLDDVLGGHAGELGKRPPLGETTIRTGGRDLLVEHMRAPLEDGSGRVIGSIVHFRDVTEVRRMSQKLGEFEKYRALGDLAVGLAHEIRNPLGSIMGSIELVMESAGLSEEDRRLLHIVDLETEKIEKLVTSLFNLARPPEPVLARVEVSRLLGDVADLCSRDRDVRALTLEEGIDDGLAIVADRDQIGQVIVNLVRNAVEASRETGGPITLGAGASPDGFVEIRVTDSGRGLDPEILDRIYDPYFTTKSYGLGVGLALCKVIVERHRGTITIENRPDGGALARIRLPDARAIF